MNKSFIHDKLIAYLGICWLALFFGFPLHAQMMSRDEMIQKLQNEKTDSLRIDLMLGLVLRYLPINPDSSTYFAQEALQVAKKIKDTKRQAAALHQIGQSKQFKEDYEEAKVFFYQALQLAEKHQYALIKAHVLGSLGGIEYQNSQFDSALDYFLKALRSYEAINDQTGQARLLHNIATLYYEQQDFEQALKYIEHSLAIKKATNDLHTIGNTYIATADAYAALKKYDQALDYYQQGIKAHENAQSFRGLAIAYTNLGLLFKDLQKYDQAIEYYQKSLAVDEQMGNREGIALNLINLAEIYRQKQDYVLAESQLMHAVTLLEELKMKHQLQKALRDLADLQDDQGKHTAALQTLKRYISIKDSVFSEQKSRQIAEMQTKYETEKKEQENQLLQAKNDRSRLLLSVAILLIISLMITATALFRIKHIQLTHTKVTLMRKEQELMSYASHLMEKDDFISEMQAQLAEIQNEQNQQKIKTIDALLNARISTEEEWLRFRQNFEMMYPDFFQRLKEQFPQLSANEMKICAVEKLGLKDLQAGDLLGVNPTSVKKSRYRLRKNLDEMKSQELQNFIHTFPHG